MATRKTGPTDLSDLKQRLGFSSESKSVKSDDDVSDDTTDEGAGDAAEGDPTEPQASADADTPDAAESTDAAAEPPDADEQPADEPVTEAPTEASGTSETAEQTPADSPAAAPTSAGAAYATQVAEDAPDPTPGSIEPIDIAGEGSGFSVPTGAIVAIFICLIGGLAFGWVAGSVMQDRHLYNAQISDATRLLGTVQPAANRLATLGNDVGGIVLENGYSEELDAKLRGEFAENPPILEATTLASARGLMAYDAETARMLVNYSLNTHLLDSLVKRHLAATEREADQIQAELEGRADDTNYALMFDFAGQREAYRQFIEDPENSPFTPQPALRVAYDDLEVITRGEGEEAVDLFSVELPTGATEEVPIYNVLVLDRQQLLEGVGDTALARYGRRVGQIKELLDQVVSTQPALVEKLDEIANRRPLFAI